jgi:hypothetical protein
MHENVLYLHFASGLLKIFLDIFVHKIYIEDNFLIILKGVWGFKEPFIKPVGIKNSYDYD